LDFLLGGPDGADRSLRLRGRTLAPGDPLLDSLPLRAGSPFHDPAQAGVIVTPEFLRLLGLPADAAAGTELHVRARASGARVAVPLVGVTSDRLPLGHQFVLTEAYETQLLTTEPDVPAPAIRTGPIPEQWPRPRELPAAVRQALKVFDLDLPAREERLGKPPVWQISSFRDHPPRCSDWRLYLRRISEMMEAEGFPRAAEIDRIDAPSAHPRPPQREGYDLAGVYLRDLPELRPAADAIRARTQLQIVNEGVIDQLNDIAAASRSALVVLSSVLAVVWLVAAVNLVVLLELRTQHKVAEVGLLRAIGISDALLRQIYEMEGALLWLLGVGVGLLLAAAAGAGLLGWLVPGEAWAVVANGRLLWPGTVLLAVSALVCWLGTRYATAAARRAAPAESLRKQ
jgi:hypothetical protein